MDQLVSEALKLGISGLFFIMWWMERKDGRKLEDILKEVTQMAQNSLKREEELLRVVKENTQAITKLTSIVEDNHVQA